MKWFPNYHKVIKIINAVKSAAKSANKMFSKDYLKEYIQRLINISPIKENIISKDPTALYPIENISGYSILDEYPDREGALSILKQHGFSIASIDSSYHSPGGHGYIPLLIHNIGIWYIDYKNAIGGEDNRVFTAVRFEHGDINERIWMKRNEGDVLRSIVPKLNGDYKIVMLDESLSLGYTATWSREDKLDYASTIAEYINELVKYGVIPLGIFYTRSIDIARGMRDIGIISDDELEAKYAIPDKIIINGMLRPGMRSPRFRVYSEAHEDTGLKLNAIYIKLSEYNVLRVEYPADIDNVNIIHLAVLLESIVGDGYPYPLQASHENAVLTGEIRDLITEVFSEILGIPHEIYLSSKEVSKRWPIA